MIRAYLLAIVLSGCAAASAQTSSGDTIPVYGTHDGRGRVLLRWAPPGVDAFYAADSLGYIVERMGPTTGTWEPVGPVPTRRYPDERLYTLGDTLRGVSVFFMATRPDSFVRGGDMGPEAAFEAAENLSTLVALGMMATLYDARVAEAAGMYTEDTPPEGVWAYRVSIPDTDYAPGLVAVDTRRPPPPRPAVAEVEAQWSDRSVSLTWDWPPAGDPAFFRVYRRTPGDTFALASPYPILSDPGERLLFQDSLADNDTEYTYAVRVGDHFGRLGPYGAAAVGRGVPPIAISAPRLDAPTELPGPRVLLRWDYDATVDSGAVVEQRVYRALQDDGPFQQLPVRLGADARSYVDSGEVAEQQYYRVEAFDAYGRTRHSATAYFLALDTVPPPPPVGLVGRADTAGRVSLAWLPVPDPGLLGYRIFYSTTRAHPGSRLTPKHLTANRATDSLSLVGLGDSVYYRVVALDLRDNVSDFSAPVAVALPDVRPPDPALLLNTRGDTLGVDVAYVPSPSRDVVREEWRRRARGTTTWLPFATRVPPTVGLDTAAADVGPRRHLFDDTVSDAYEFDYQLVVYDEAGLRAVSNVVPGRRRRSPFVTGVSGLSAKPDDDGRAVTLQWRLDNPDLVAFRLYRAPGDAPLQTYRELDAADLDRKGPNRRDGSYLLRWRDRDAAYAQPYRYELVGVARDGRETRGVPTSVTW